MKTGSRKFLGLPTTRLGWWAGGLAVIFIVLFILISNSTLFFSGFLNKIFGFTAGVFGLTAMIQQGERSWFVWLAILCGLFVVLVMFGEILAPR